MEKLQVQFHLNIPCTIKDIEKYLQDVDIVTNYFSNYQDSAFNALKCDISVNDGFFVWNVYSKTPNFFTENEERRLVVFEEIKSNVRGGIFSNFVFEADLDTNEYFDETEFSEEPIIDPWSATYKCSKWDGKSKEGWF